MTTRVSTTFENDAPLPLGFAFGGARCGIKQARSDLGVLISDRPAVAAGTFTVNRMRAPCVSRNAELLPAEGVRAVAVNSGNANAMTGSHGVEANRQIAAAFAGALDVEPATVLTASTGIIGVPLPAELVAEAAPALVEHAGADPRPFAEAILTTDTGTKLAWVELEIGGRPVRITGVAKGSGMVHPNMATTLAFVSTDARISPAALQRLLGEVVDDTFHAITVDGDTSTNDMVLVLANGASDVAVEGEALAAFRDGLFAVLDSLARQVVRDGEGATRTLEVEVTGAPDAHTARAIARGVCRSNLVKCSAFAGQAEWGRVAMAVGHAAAELALDLDPSSLTIAAQGTVLYDRDGPKPGVHAANLRRLLRQGEVRWTVDLGLGSASGRAMGCDLSYDYVRINADEAKQIEVGRAGQVSRNLSLAAYSPRLKQQLLVEGLAYVRRFTGMRALVYLQPSACRTGDPVTSLARDLELCVDAGLRPLAVVPSTDAADVIAKHMQSTGHFVSSVPPEPVAIGRFLDNGHCCVLVREQPDPDAIVDLALKLGIQKLLALGTDPGIRDAHGFVQRVSPDSLLAGLERGRFDTTDPDLLVLARQAAARGVPALHVIDARVPHALVGELFTDEGIGTLVTRQALA